MGTAKRPKALVPALLAVTVAFAVGSSLFWFIASPESQPPLSGAVKASAPETLTIEPPPFKPGRSRVVFGDSEALFLRGIEEYNGRKYAQASETFLKSATLKPDAPEAHFFLGISYLFTKDDGAGISELKTCLQLGDHQYGEEAKFYIGLASARRGDTATARRFLSEVAGSGGALAQKAREARSALGASVAF